MEKSRTEGTLLDHAHHARVNQRARHAADRSLPILTYRLCRLNCIGRLLPLGRSERRESPHHLHSICISFTWDFPQLDTTGRVISGVRER